MSALGPLRLFAMIVLSILLGGALGSCSEPIAPTLDITPPSGTVVNGREVQLTVARSFPGGQVEDVTSAVTYLSLDRAILDVTKEGRLVPGEQAGTAIVRVDDFSTGAFTTATYTVAPAMIAALDVVPSPEVVLAPGEKRAFSARGRFTDGTTRDVTKDVQWSSSNGAIATVGNTTNDAGMVTAVTVGDAIIVAHDSVSGVEARTTVSVRGNALVAITVTPNPAVVPIGGSTQFSALGLYSDGSSSPIGSSVLWTSSDDKILKIDVNGLATAVAAGSVTITAERVESGIRGSAAAKVE